MLDRPDPGKNRILPFAVNEILATLWIILLVGRYSIVFFLLISGVLNVAQLEAVVDPALSRVYLILFVISVVIVVLRVMRGMQTKSPTFSPDYGSASDAEIRSASVLKTREPEENPE